MRLPDASGTAAERLADDGALTAREVGLVWLGLIFAHLGREEDLVEGSQVHWAWLSLGTT